MSEAARLIEPIREALDWIPDDPTQFGEHARAALRDLEVRIARWERIEKTLERVRENARSWHGVPDETDGHVKALKVIAQWCDAALAAETRGGER